MKCTRQSAVASAGTPVVPARHAAANVLRTTPRAAAPVGRRSVVTTKAIKVADHTEARQYIDTRHHAHIHNHREYDEMYQRSIQDPNGFWRDIATNSFHWETPIPENHHSHNFDVKKGPIFAEWFKGGKTNIAYNCLDRHVKEGHGAQPCFLFEGNDPGRDGVITYEQVLKEVCRVSNWLRSVGVKKGDSVAIYMPMVCELPIAMLACARIGAIHSVVFGGFSSDALASRIEDCKSRVVITCNGVKRATKSINLKKIADQGCDIAQQQGFTVEHCLVYANEDAASKEDTNMVAGRDLFWQDIIPKQADTAEVEWMDSEDTLFFLYTSGSTGKPKGVVHSTGGFMVYAATTCKYTFAMQPGDVYCCHSTLMRYPHDPLLPLPPPRPSPGHSYLAYGPLLNHATQVVFEGVPTYPDAGRCWEVIDKYQVKQFYTAPTAIRSLMRSGEEWVKKHNRSSLRVLGSVGEPINPEAWKWYHEVVGDGRCPIVDTWWQTETAGHMITNLPAAWPEKPGSASLPFFGVKPVIVDEKGNELEGECEGYLCIKQSATKPPCRLPRLLLLRRWRPPRDKDGYYWITGRVGDVINVSGHRIGTAEVESALVSHPQCAEAAVVGYEHPVKGQGIWAYVTLLEDVEYDDKLKKELVMSVRDQIGAFAAPDVIHWAPGLPKTRSGNIMRRVLRKIAAFEED
ncbi:acetyl-synthetase [Micractinium conductrix]|uniref:acetate--CoA ligase n=1 Tax=Micractinium conductrix TaxID=554055 RepID=A0A2P6VQS0_9CHLO|nr:acetyl-synthetase [Micractinium conductrix]|eukprot:PSC76405.1 acetyl-synthetase [Micractinium conductrix]